MDEAESGPMAIVSSRQASDVVFTGGDLSRSNLFGELRKAVSEFLGIPLAIVAGMALTGLVLFLIEKAEPAWILPLKTSISRYFFSSYESTGRLLDMLAGGIITMTSIIVSMLLLVLQQSAGNLGNMVYDQFLQRRSNQIYTGLVVGAVILVTITSATVSETYNPVLGGALALSVVLFVVILLLFFLYFTIEQMRPEEIINKVYMRILSAREKQLELICRTRDERKLASGYLVELRSEQNGYIVEIDFDLLERCVEQHGGEIEIGILGNIGAYIHFHDCLAEVWSTDLEWARQAANGAGSAFRLAKIREMTLDPAFGLQQLEMMAWTEMSSAKQNPETGLLVVNVLRDILSRWILEEMQPPTHRIAVVYHDHYPPDVINTLESLSVSAAEGMQHQNLAEILRTVEELFDQLQPDLQQRTEAMIRRMIPGIKMHRMTKSLKNASERLICRLERAGRSHTAEMLAQAIGDLDERAMEAASTIEMFDQR